MSWNLSLSSEADVEEMPYLPAGKRLSEAICQVGLTNMRSRLRILRRGQLHRRAFIGTYPPQPVSTTSMSALPLATAEANKLSAGLPAK